MSKPARHKTHKDVEWAVDDASGKQRIFKKFDEAAGFAVAIAASGKPTVNLDTLCYSAAGARFAGLEEEYEEDPEASVTCRLEVSVNYTGRIS